MSTSSLGTEPANTHIAEMGLVHRRAYGTGGGGGAAAPPIRAVCRHEFGQRVDNIRAKYNTCLNNPNLGSVTAVNGKKDEFRVCYCCKRKKFCHPTEYGSRKISATTPPHRIWIPENFCSYPPPPTESIRAKLGLPPQMDVGPYAYGLVARIQ